MSAQERSDASGRSSSEKTRDATSAEAAEATAGAGPLSHLPSCGEDSPGAYRRRKDGELPQIPNPWSAFDIQPTPPRYPQRDHFDRLTAEALSSSRARPLKKLKHEEENEEKLNDHDNGEGSPFSFRAPPGVQRRSMAWERVHHSGDFGSMADSRMQGAFAEGNMKTPVLAGNMGGAGGGGGGGGGVRSPADYVYRGCFVEGRGSLGGVPADLGRRSVGVAGVGLPRDDGGSSSSNGGGVEEQERPDRKRTAIDAGRRREGFRGPLFLKASDDRHLYARPPIPPSSPAQERHPLEEGGDGFPVSGGEPFETAPRSPMPPIPADRLFDEVDEEENEEEAIIGEEGAGEGGDDGNESDPEEGPECRVCRGDDEGGRRPLVHPCRCRGSIKYVHQDCLLEWLKSRQGGIMGGGAGAAGGGANAAAAPVLQAQRCELCREKLVFKARYRPGAPTQLGLSEFLRGAVRRATPRFMDAFRGTLNMLMWGVAVPILYCTMLRAGLGAALLFTQEFAAFVRGDGNPVGSPVFYAVEASSVEEQAGTLPGIERVCWSSLMDLLGDWCGGVSLMIGVICLGPPCVEIAVDFVTLLKTLPVVVEEWWTQRPAAAGQVDALRRDRGIRPRNEDVRHRGGVLGALDRVEVMLMGVLEQLAAPPREEDAEGEAVIWGWPAVGTAGSFLAFMGLLVLFAQTLPYATYHAINTATSPTGRSHPFPYSVLHPVPEKLFSWNSVRRPSAAATAAFTYTSLESKAYGIGLETLGFSSKWASFEESDGGAFDPMSSEAVGFSGAMAEARVRSNALRLRAYHPAVATVSVEAAATASGSKLPFTAAPQAASKGELAESVGRMFFIPSPLFYTASYDGDSGYDASVIPKQPVMIMTKRNILERNEIGGDGYDSGKFRLVSDGLKPLEKLVTPEEALSRGTRNRGNSWFASWRAKTNSGVGRMDFHSEINDQEQGDEAESSWWWGPYKMNERLVARPWVPGRRAVPSASVYASLSEAFLLDWVGDYEVIVSVEKAYRRRPKWFPPHSSIHETSRNGKGGNEQGDSMSGESLISEWWRTSMSFMRGPIIPGTAGLRVGAVFFDTFKGLCMLGFSMLLLCIVFSIARLYKIPNRDESRRNSNRAAPAAPAPAAPAAAVAADGAAEAGGVVQDRVQDGFDLGRGGLNMDHEIVLNRAEAAWMERIGQEERGRMGGGMLERDGQIGLDIKVLTIGTLELFILPIWVGVSLDLFSLPLFDSNPDARLTWAVVNPVSSMALHWGAGTMATGVVGCLGREVSRALHPNLLPAWMVRPAEQGLEEMLVRMTHDPFLSQLRGLLVSLVAYPVVLGFMVTVPIEIYGLLSNMWWPSWLEDIEPVVLGIGEATEGDRLGMDLVLFHFILPVLMEHLKIRGPVRRVACWVLTTACGVTGSKDLLLHPALVAGRGAAANDPDDLDDIELPAGPAPGVDNSNVNGNEEGEGVDDSYSAFFWDHFRLFSALLMMAFAFVLLPAVTLLLPLFTGRAMFDILGLPLDDDLPPVVAGAIGCSSAIWALSALLKVQVTAGQRRRVAWDFLVLSGKWLVIGFLLVVALPSLTGLLVHDALRGPLPPAEETAVLTWGKIWALGLVCVKLWARCVMAGAIGNEAWQGRLRRIRINGIRGIDFKYTLHEVCIPLLDGVAQYYFWPYLLNRFVLPMLVANQRDLRIRQKGMPFVFLLLKGVCAAVMYGVRKIKALHDLIRDDEYLLGLELENMPHDT